MGKLPETIISATHGIRDFLLDIGLNPVWHITYHLLNYNVLGSIALLLLIQAFWPANKSHRLISQHLVLDFAYPVANILIAAVAIWPLLFGASELSHKLWPKLLADLPGPAEFICAFLILDFMHYLSHVARHKTRWLWHFHSIHHSQVELNPATTFRTHVLDSASNVFILTLAYGLIGSDPTPWIYAGITAQFWDLFIHSNIRTNLGPFGWLLVSPQFHRVHHSIQPEHADRNFGDRLIVWDLLFRTAVLDRKVYPATGILDTMDIVETGHGPKAMVIACVKQALHPFKQIAPPSFIPKQRRKLRP